MPTDQMSPLKEQGSHLTVLNDVSQRPSHGQKATSKSRSTNSGCGNVSSGQAHSLSPDQIYLMERYYSPSLPGLSEVAEYMAVSSPLAKRLHRQAVRILQVQLSLQEHFRFRGLTIAGPPPFDTAA